LKVAQALRLDVDHEQIYLSCRIDPWFVAQLQEIVDWEKRVRKFGLPESAYLFRALKAKGFSDERLATLAQLPVEEVTRRRHALGIHPVYKRIDTCAAEFRSPTPYMYSTYESGFGSPPVCEADPSDREKIIILGSGPNRIGQGIEFDYCCCHAAFALSKAGYETIMVNCNPETVSTDYDTSDRLYFEPLTTEDVLEIVDTEQSRGTVQGLIVQFGGQTPLKLAQPLADEGAPILGTSVDAIDLAEDRDRFQALLRKIGLKQPDNTIAASIDAARAAAGRIGYPVMLRPSYVLGGLAMRIVHTEEELTDYVAQISRALGGPSELVVSDKRPLLVDRYLRDAIEVDVDAICDGEDVFVAGVMEHIEEAGVHSGDSACALPPYSLPKKIIAEIEAQTKTLALALDVRGLINIQFAVKDGDIYILEANPRASRTAPFVAKAINRPIAAAAAKVMAGMTLKELKLDRPSKAHVAVKEAVFPFARFPGVDPVLGPEMRSTGEVMGLDQNFEAAFAKSQIASGVNLPTEGCVFISVKDLDKPALAPIAKDLLDLGFQIMATGGTVDYLATKGIDVQRVNKVAEGRPHVVDAMKNGEVQLVFNTTEGAQSYRDSYSIRRTALTQNIPYYTTISGARAAIQAIRRLKTGAPLGVRALQAYA
jgi:carbamoyl-phosphate synthase large subunit